MQEPGQELAQELLEQPESEELWRRFVSLGAGERESVALHLKASVDALVRSDPPAALAAADVLSRAIPSVPGREALAARGLAAAAHANGLADQALAHYLEAARLHTEAGEEVELGRVQRSLVDVYQMSGQADEALRRADLAREVFERHGEDRLLAQLDVNVGNVFVRLDDYDNAQKHYRRASAELERLGDTVVHAMVEYNLGVTATNANACDEAEAAFRRASAVFSEAGMSVHVADCHYMVAYLESRRGRFADAIRGLEQARELYTECGKPSGAPLCDLDLAEIYLRLDARRDCLEHGRKAATRFDELGLEYERAKATLFTSVALARLGSPVEARAQMDLASEIMERLGNQAWPAILELHRSALELDDASDESLARLRGARGRLDDQGLRLWRDLATTAVARALVARGDLDGATAELEGLLLERNRSSDLDAMVSTEARLVAARERLAAGDLDAAIAYLEQAVEEIDATWSEVPGADVRIAFFRERHDAFVDLALLLAEHRGEHAEAFRLLEHSRLRSFMQMSVAPRREDPGLRCARERLDWLLGRKLDQAIGPAAADREVRGRGISDAEVLEAEREVRRLTPPAIRKAVSGVEHTRTDPASFASELDEDEALLAWATTRRGTRAFLCDREHVASVPLEADAATLRKLQNRLFFQLDKYRLGAAYEARHRERLEHSIELVLDELGALLLAPLRSRLEGRRLRVLPYGLLHGLPVHAMRIDGAPLVASSEVTYGLSVSHLASCRAHRPAHCSALVVGADDDTLPAVAHEIERVQARYPTRAEIIPAESLRAHLAEHPPTGGLLHIAAHGTFRPENPIFSGVRLGSTFLTGQDLASMQLPFDLVTLSGCETGRMLRVGGEELLGLTRSIFEAGARSVLSSLWPVSDDDSAAFMDAFYGRLAGGLPSGRAVAEAQRALMQERPHPFSWAAFVLTGAPDLLFAAEPPEHPDKSLDDQHVA